MNKSKLRRIQKQRNTKRRRSLHDKHRKRRKKDLMIGMPFIVGYQGDPAMGSRFFCNDVRGYQLIAPKGYKPFERLHKYLMKAISSIFKIDFKILVKEAI